MQIFLQASPFKSRCILATADGLRHGIRQQSIYVFCVPSRYKSAYDMVARGKRLVLAENVANHRTEILYIIIDGIRAWPCRFAKSYAINMVWEHRADCMTRGATIGTRGDENCCLTQSSALHTYKSFCGQVYCFYFPHFELLFPHITHSTRASSLNEGNICRVENVRAQQPYILRTGFMGFSNSGPIKGY